MNILIQRCKPSLLLYIMEKVCILWCGYWCRWGCGLRAGSVVGKSFDAKLATTINAKKWGKTVGFVALYSIWVGRVSRSLVFRIPLPDWPVLLADSAWKWEKEVRTWIWTGLEFFPEYQASRNLRTGRVPALLNMMAPSNSKWWPCSSIRAETRKVWSWLLTACLRSYIPVLSFFPVWPA